MLRRLLRSSLVSASFLVILLPNIAQAETGHLENEQKGTSKTKVDTGMNVVGFNREVAERNGYKIVRLPDGREASVKKEKARAYASGRLKPSDEDTKWGNCGYSFVEIYSDTPGEVVYRTGFGLDTAIPPAYDLQWRAAILDSGGVFPIEMDGPIEPTWKWNTGVKTTAEPSGSKATITVDGRQSFAILTNGTVCYSHNPTATVTVL